MAMTNFDYAPFWRSTVGFDRLFDMLEDDAFALANGQSYPPYNIERTGEHSYEVTLALAGFLPEEITVTAAQNVLTIEGRKTDATERHYLHKGISARPFRRQFSLADHVEVAGATFENGVLQIRMVREIPEAMKPRRVEIKTDARADQRMDQLKAA
jgi:molecular chaperone IbpA